MIIQGHICTAAARLNDTVDWYDDYYDPDYWLDPMSLTTVAMATDLSTPHDAGGRQSSNDDRTVVEIDLLKDDLAGKMRKYLF